MSRNIANHLIWNYGRIVNCKNINGLASVRFVYTNSNLLWGQSTGVTPNYRGFSTRESDTPTPSTISIMPKINALLNDTKKLTPASTNLINNGKSLFRRQWEAFFNWYDEISHTNEVRTAHKQVEELQDKLNQAQQLRRDVSKELNDIRYELQMCYADQANCQKSDPRFLELIRREIEVSENLSEANWNESFCTSE